MEDLNIITFVEQRHSETLTTPLDHDSIKNVLSSCAKLIQSKGLNNSRLQWKESMKIEITLPQPHEGPNNNSSLVLATPPLIPRATLTLEKASEYEINHRRGLDPDVDLRKLRRTISNKLSAQRSRMRRNKYVEDLEKKLKYLQEVIPYLKKEVESHNERKNILMEQNGSLKELLEIRSNESKILDMDLEKKREEVNRLRAEVAKKMEAHAKKKQEEEAEGYQYLNLEVLNVHGDHQTMA